MVWIIIGIVVIAAVVFWVTKRMKVLKERDELQATIQSVMASFRELKEKINQSGLRDNEKKILLSNVDRNIDQLERWESSSLPSITLFKNHTAPIEKEFRNLQESVAAELSKYDELSDSIPEV